MSTLTDTTTTTTTLAAPLTLPDGASIKNRLVKAAMSEQLAGPANQPTAELARVYRRWAHGGAGLIITGNVMIDRRSLGEPLHVVVEDDRDIEPLQHWAAAAKSDGATALVQINHPGRQTFAGLSELAVAPSAVQVDMGPAFAKPRALTAEEIVDLIARFRADRANRRQGRLRRCPDPRRPRLPHQSLAPRLPTAATTTGAVTPSDAAGFCSSHPSRARGDRRRHDPRDQAQLRRLPARRLHRG